MTYDRSDVIILFVNI